MDTVESQRVLSVLAEAVDGIRCVRAAVHAPVLLSLLPALRPSPHHGGHLSCYCCTTHLHLHHRALSHCTQEVLAAAAAQQLGGVLGAGVQDALQRHAAAAAEQLSQQQEQLPSCDAVDALLPSAAALLRALQRSAADGGEDALASLHTSRSPAVLQLLSFLERVRARHGVWARGYACVCADVCADVPPAACMCSNQESPP